MSGYAGEMEEREQNGRRGRSRAAGAGVMLGALAAGVAIGVLTAPSEGRKTRRRLRRQLAGLAESPAARLAALGGVGRRAGRQVRDRLDELGEGLGRRARDWRAERGEGLNELQERLEALEERLHGRLGDAEDDIEEEVDRVMEAAEQRRGGGLSRVVGFALGAGLTYFLVSDRTAMARERVQEAASKARRRATDEWDRFQREGGFQRFKDGVNGSSERMESQTGATSAEGQKQY